MVADPRKRFEFGANWARFLDLVDEDRIERAERSLLEMLAVTDLRGLRFLDAGSGSGLFSLAAHRLGAEVISFDYDPRSVACAIELRRRFAGDDRGWRVEQGSVLDPGFVAGLGDFDLVYSWGVLHHTGHVWAGLGSLLPRVRPGGRLFIALYNDQGWRSRAWRALKWAYITLPRPLRFLVLWPAGLRLWGPTSVRDLVRGHPGRTWRSYSSVRGMSPWRDVVDWVGGYPFEVASVAQVRGRLEAAGMVVERVTDAGRGLGCNEFVARRPPP